MTAMLAQAGASTGSRGRLALGILALVLFVNYLDRYALSVLLEGIKADLRLSDTQVGLLTGAAFALLYATLAMPVARIAEHKNRVMVLTIAILLWSAGTFLCGLAGSYAMLFLARMLVGTGESGVMPTSHSIVGDSYPMARRGTALAILSCGGALGTALAPAIAGYLEDRLGWRGTFMALGLLGLPVALALAWVVKDPARGLSDGRPAGDAPPFIVALKRLLSRPAFVLMAPAMVITGLAEYSLFLWLPSYLSRTYGGSAASVGAMLTLFQGLPLFAGTLAGGMIIDRLVRRDPRWLARVPAIACLLAAPSILLIFISPSLEIALAMMIIPSLALGLYLAPCYTLLQSVAGARSRATAVALMTFLVNVIGLGFGPVLIGGLSDILKAAHGADSLRLAFFVVPPLYLTAGATYLLIARFVPSAMAAASQESVAD
ncbi:MFS transporter [Sphingobium sp. HBC34]|uniref:MFS transporter n=1 Tax=Sphingobium cyanobacteriorum TaxID=3063954 RepID=A0ABT8ZN14_9SPHN|nr:MFS transporter [Sphingobium sp. HBC34]MDO7835596.1 MFS transporter [Sphingobium sp. HBC34]